MIHFTKPTIRNVVGEVMTALTNCKQLRTKGISYRFLCKIYDSNANMIAEYAPTKKDVFATITKEMHKIKEGYVECICNPHPVVFR